MRVRILLTGASDGLLVYGLLAFGYAQLPMTMMSSPRLLCATRRISGRPTQSLALLVAIVLVVSCGKESHPVAARPYVPDPTPPNAASWFVDVAEDAGIVFRHNSHPAGEFFLPEIIGSGAALFDYDNDGDLDLFLVDSGQDPGMGATDRLYRQEDNGSFTERTVEAGLNSNGYGMGATLGDIDNDGDVDLYVTNLGEDVLYRNNGDGTFSDVGPTSGLSATAFSTSAVFFDYDLDGLLDLFVATYVRLPRTKSCSGPGGRIEYCGPIAFDGVPDYLFHNDGNGHFTDVSNASGIGSVASKGLGVVSLDFNMDGAPDILVANDSENNDLWINRGDGTFSNQAVVMGAAVNIFGKPEASMGIAVGDIDGDLRPDVLMTHLRAETNTVYRAIAGGGLQDSTPRSGLGPASMRYTGFGAAFFDAENDGDLDLIVANGKVTRTSRHADIGTVAAAIETDGSVLTLAEYAEPDMLFLNDGRGHFDYRCDLAPDLCQREEVGRGLTIGDIDGDGALDVVVTGSNAPARLYRNESSPRGHWIRIRALERDRTRDAIGAYVYLTTPSGTQVRVVSHAYSFLSASDATTHFGLGDADAVESIRIRWADGCEETFPGAAVDQTISVVRGTGIGNDDEPGT